jgi:maltose O-acetyltransferase
MDMRGLIRRIVVWYRILRAVDNVFQLKCGKNFFVGGGSLVYPVRHMVFGKNVFIGRNVTISTSESGKSPVYIGRDVMIAQRCMIIGGNHEIERTDIPMNLQGEGKQGAIVVGDDVWIGAGTIVLGPVTIGRGCVIGAGSVVTKDLPDYSVAVGNPARVIRNRLKRGP